MTAATTPVATTSTTPARTRDVPRGLVWMWRDTWTEAMRHLRAVPRNPDLLIFATIQPIMFVLLFNYVFGGSIDVPGYASYTQFLIPGVFAQTVLFGSAFTGIGVAEDMQKGIIDRLRSLPMYQPSVLVGRTVSDLCRNIFTFFVMFIVGYLVGFRIQGTIAAALGATLLLLGFSYAFSWVQALIGLSVKSVEAANSAGFIWMFPLTFVSSAFVSTESMPTWLQTFADWNPFTKLTNAARALYNGTNPGADLWYAIGWAVGITIVFSFLASRKFQKGAGA
jgi:ABC-2 type transport system permease protein